MNEGILIKALSFIAREDGGVVELNGKACYMLAIEALKEYRAAQQSVQRTAETHDPNLDYWYDEASDTVRRVE